MSRAAISWALLILALGQPALAHDFWVQPDAFWLAPDAGTSLTLQVGHGAERQRSAILLGRITRFVAVAPSGAIIDLRPSLRLGGAEADGVLNLQAPGVHVLALATDNRARSRLSANRFDAYAREEGLTPAAGRPRPANVEISERYSRVAKSIVMVGDPGVGAHAAATRAVGLALEIVPEVSPYAEPRAAILPVRAIYEGRPLAGALIKLTDLDRDAAPFEIRRTDQAGRASFTMPTHGRWLLNVVWTKSLTSSADADFETVFSSLSFGVPSGTGAGTPTGNAHRPSGTRR
ncbi:DUF4198 domain-containing protein [Phenylobacterium sp.]|uniref:DUF4198 domain-containing protein n=1 Tax=Phenylobacterium sp. TaxID=1871053 RepID=UPI002FC5D9EC